MINWPTLDEIEYHKKKDLNISSFSRMIFRQWLVNSQRGEEKATYANCALNSKVLRDICAVCCKSGQLALTVCFKFDDGKKNLSRLDSVTNWLGGVITFWLLSSLSLSFVAGLLICCYQLEVEIFLC